MNFFGNAKMQYNPIDFEQALIWDLNLKISDKSILNQFFY